MREMTLSEAIRLGSMMKPQGFGGGGEPYVSEKHTCALGAAGEAMGIEWDRYDKCAPYPELFRAYPWLDTRQRCPVCRSHNGSGMAIVFHLNDDHRWTREQIADFVKTYESPQAGDAVAGTPEVNSELPVRA